MRLICGDWLKSLPTFGASIACLLFVGGALFGWTGATVGVILGVAVGVAEAHK